MSATASTRDARRFDPMPGRSARSRRRSRRLNIPPLRGLLPLVVALGIWQLIQHGQSAYFPRPSLWWTAIEAQWSNGALGPAIRETMTAFVWSLIIATVLGTALGILIGRSRSADRALGPLLDFCRFMPAAAVVPIVVLFAGYTNTMTIVVVVFAAIWPILLQVRDATHSEPAARRRCQVTAPRSVADDQADHAAVARAVDPAGPARGGAHGLDRRAAG